MLITIAISPSDSDTNYQVNTSYAYLSPNTMEFKQLCSGMLIWLTTQVLQVVDRMMLFDVLSRLGNVRCTISESQVS